MSDGKLSRLALCGVLACCLIGSGRALGVVISWTGGSGMWGVAENWTPAQVPSAQDDVSLLPDEIATITADADAQAQSLDIAGNATLRVTAGTLEVKYDGIRCDGAIEVDPGASLSAPYDVTIVGHTGTGTFSQTGGEVTVPWLTLGNEVGSEGFYHLSGSGQLTVGEGAPIGGMTIGWFGTGVFTQTGGTVMLHKFSYGPILRVGSEKGSSGAYTISGGTLEVDYLTVGTRVGSGTFEIASSASSITVWQDLHVDRRGSLIAVPGSTIYMTTSDFRNESHEPTALAGLSNLTLVFGSARYSRTYSELEVASRDIGPAEGGYAGNFSVGVLELGNEGTPGDVGLRDRADNWWDGAGIDALYVGRVLVRNASVLEMNGLSVYAGEFSVDVGSRVDVQGGTLAVSGDVEALLNGYIGTRLVDSLLSPLMELDAQYDSAAAWTSVLAVPKPGADTRWQGDPAMPGDWFTPANWTNGVPDSSHVNIIDNGGTAEMTTGIAQVGKFLYLGYDAAKSGNLLLSGSAELSADAQYVGYRGIGRLTQTAGTNTLSGDLYLGYHSESNGTYELAGNGTLQAKNEHVGRAGTGRLKQTGGANTVAYLYVGDGLGSHGTYEHTGGTNHVTENLVVGFDSGSEGTYVLDGTGQLNVRLDEYIGLFGHGTFLHTGGTNSAEKLIIMRADPDGTYRLGGTGQLIAEYEWIGFGTQGGATQPRGENTKYEHFGSAGVGTFVQTGGTNTVQRFSLGYSPGSEGTYELRESGELHAYLEYVGHEGRGRLTQTGGTNNVDLALYVGYEEGGEGTYELSGGVLSCGQEIRTRGEYVGHRGRGHFIHSGGTNTFNKLQIGWSDEGVYELSGTGRLIGGVVIVGHVGYSGPGTFVYAGGEMDVDKFIVTSMGKFIQADAATAYDAFGLNGRYELGGNGQLTAENGYIGYDFGTAEEYAEDEATGVFIQTGGTFLVTDRFVLGSQPSLNGVYSISAGSLNAGDLVIGSTGNGRLEITDAAGNVTVAERLVLGQTGSLMAVSGSKIHMTGSAFENDSTDPTAWADLANLTLSFEGGNSRLDRFEVAGEDRGPVAAGFEDNFALGTLQLGGEAAVGRVGLADVRDNRPDWEGSEALYLDRLVVSGGSSLELNGLNLYARLVSIESEGLVDIQGGVFSVLGNMELGLDAWIGTRLIDSQLPPGLHLDAVYDPATDFTIVRAVPEPAALLLLVSGGLCLVIWARGKRHPE